MRFASGVRQLSVPKKRMWTSVGICVCTMRTMIEPEKFFDHIRNSGAGRASSSLFQRSDGRRLMMTLTDELFLPARIVYRVKDQEELLSKFQNLRCTMFDPFRARWMWQYEFEATRIGFPVKYNRVPREHQPLVLASCYLLDRGAMHVYIRSALRVCKALVFFDRHIRRACARAEYMDEYNLLTAQEPQQPLPEPEDFFKDESRICFNDIESIADDPARLAAELAAIPERTLEPLERHRLTAYYEDGEQHVKGAMRMRELMAMAQYFSDTPIKPYQLIRELLQSFDKTEAAPHKKSQSAPAAPASVILQARAAKVGRKDPCPCGSGKKFKKCCGG